MDGDSFTMVSSENARRGPHEGTAPHSANLQWSRAAFTDGSRAASGEATSVHASIRT